MFDESRKFDCGSAKNTMSMPNRPSITEGVYGSTTSDNPSSILIDCVSLRDNKNCEVSIETEDGNGEIHHLVHYGSTCTTCSTGSSNFTNSSFGAIGCSLDQTSVASSSGVATMSSVDNLTATLSFIRNYADDSTPTITLTDGRPFDKLQREIQPLLVQPATTAAITDSTASNAFSSLSLNAKHISDKIADMTTLNANSSPPLASVRDQAQSTSSLLCNYKDVHICAAGNKNSSSILHQYGATLHTSTQELNTAQYTNLVGTVDENENDTFNRNETTTNIVSTSSMDNTSCSAQQLPSSASSHNSLFGSSPLPSVFNCAATSCSQIFCIPLRTIVSQNRRRYQMDGFNLDLTYITDRIIAMGYPASTKEALYRNSMSHIVKFLEHYHPGHYKVFNLRGQYVYDPANFHNRVVSFEMTDHHPPRLELMAPFCREVHDYLDADPLNVVAVHCKAGKGRTGVMICAYLCYITFYRTPRQNMDYYSIIRTHNNKGVTIPSQRRYVYYFAHLRERNLNYMPLRCELVGIYLERPPKLCGPFSKGALKVRVACGDVDVFLGDDLWLNGEKYEEEEELHKRFPLMSNEEEQYDPTQPNHAKNCISRRCYGWTVPENKRVFLEGDIRVDIFQKSRLKLFNVKQDKKKIGHIWFNTMFTCPGFCGGQYVHGDEAYPYPDSMIVRRRFKRKKMENIDQNISKQLPQPTSNNVKPNPITSNRLYSNHPASAPSIITQNYLSGNEQERIYIISAPEESMQISDMSSNGGIIAKTGSTHSPCRSLLEYEQKGWQSQDDGPCHIVSRTEKEPSTSTKQCHSSLDTSESEYEEEIVVDKPAGLDRHCSEASLQGIYSNEKNAPRYGIEEIIREAFQKNLINDLYNTRRMSQPRDGLVIPKAPIGRPSANGPYCLMRNFNEHVSIFGVQEIDRAYKNKDIDSTFKVFVLTRCIDESISNDVRLVDQFIRVTHQKQAQKDAQKMEKLRQKQRKLMLIQQHNFGMQQESRILSQNKKDERDSVDTSSGGEEGFTAGSISAKPSCSTSHQRHFIGDPRFNDPHLSKYFFRQRVSSQSKHPNVHHHCSLRSPDIKICQKYGCIRKGNVSQNCPIAQATRLIVPNQNIKANEEEKTETETEDATSFDDFDFFHPRQETCSTIRGFHTDHNTNNEDDDSPLTILSTKKAENNEENKPREGCFMISLCHDDVPLIDQQSQDVGVECLANTASSALSSRNWFTGKDSISSAPVSLHSELAEPEIYHPSDSSLAPSTSSSCSSSD